MTEYQNIIVETRDAVGKIVLNRPQQRNAMNIEMIRELLDAVTNLSENTQIRLIVLSGSGNSFSAGADLHWMKQGQQQSKNQLSDESLELAKLFNTIYNSPKVTVTMANGHAVGGANGIIAASDIVITAPGTVFRFSEVRLGLIPATIAPYVVRKIGESRSREWMLSARNVNAEEAFNHGLVHYLIPLEEQESFCNELFDGLLQNGPNAMTGVKKLLGNTILNDHPDRLMEYTAELIAEFRTSDEGQEGMSAFFEKRDPKWSDEK